jgi:hypothetical protein
MLAVMGDIVNLRRFRKQAARVEADKHAVEQRTRFGRSKSERDATQAETTKQNVLLDQHRIEEGKE